ncbi:hypothetical protein CC78DRAFT_543948 [Lojkania enalia]|uniref:Uncharacterized protein n=1 Tax=Lojkania enalia TaxID=147567 RepID=A0A9P4K9Q6_9PLEO|nr:hypothetical protein CC78DRAFT_543948 [Didymosphaeria enalia]
MAALAIAASSSDAVSKLPTSLDKSETNWTVTRLSTTNSDSTLLREPRSTYHIYHKKETHKCISQTIYPPKERRFGPTTKEIKAKHKQRKLEAAQKKEGTVTATSESATDGSFFLHTPYLAFHDPPRVLYDGSTKHCKPVVLIHSKFLWQRYKLQVGPSIAARGVLDPRGVVCWQQHGGNSKALKADDRKLKGYKVRTWRLWGETGKKYVHRVKAARHAGASPDPDILENEADAQTNAARADEVVYLKWSRPFSSNTRRYHFAFRGIDFYWKGTGTVQETRACGFFVRFNHLKLVAKLPAPLEVKKAGMAWIEVCLGKYTSSIAAKKCGRLELFDGAIWRLIVEHMPSALPQMLVDEDGREEVEKQSEAARTELVGKSVLYHVIVATAMCMILGEQQKRETIRAIIEALISEGAVGGVGG